jgi:hypothetical protein
VNDHADAGPNKTRLAALLRGYEITAAEARRAKSMLLNRASLVFIINGSLLGLLSVFLADSPALATIACLGVVLNVFWILINQRNRSYNRYWHDHLIVLEHQINSECAFNNREGLHTYSDLPMFSKGTPVPIVPNDEQTQICYTGRLSIERGFTLLASLVAVAWLVAIPLVLCGVILS